jgi:hypothetical protein
MNEKKHRLTELKDSPSTERTRERNCVHLQPSERREEGQREAERERERGRNFRDSDEEGQENGEKRLRNVRRRM